VGGASAVRAHILSSAAYSLGLPCDIRFPPVIVALTSCHRESILEGSMARLLNIWPIQPASTPSAEFKAVLGYCGTVVRSVHRPVGIHSIAGTEVSTYNSKTGAAAVRVAQSCFNSQVRNLRS
jgi:hypothetical protein